MTKKKINVIRCGYFSFNLYSQFISIQNDSDTMLLDGLQYQFFPIVVDVVDIVIVVDYQQMYLVYHQHRQHRHQYQHLLERN